MRCSHFLSFSVSKRLLARKHLIRSFNKLFLKVSINEFQKGLFPHEDGSKIGGKASQSILYLTKTLAKVLKKSVVRLYV